MRNRGLFLVLTWLAALAVACGGKAVLDGEPMGSGGGSSASSMRDPLDGVACGSAGSCTFECCLDLTREDVAPYCATNCASGESAYSCDGPEDCDGGECCGDILAARCKPSCELNDLERCHTDADCESGSCMSSSVSGVDQSVCG